MTQDLQRIVHLLRESELPAVVEFPGVIQISGHGVDWVIGTANDRWDADLVRDETCVHSEVLRGTSLTSSPEVVANAIRGQLFFLGRTT